MVQIVMTTEESRFPQPFSSSPIYLVEWPSVGEARIPDLVNHLGRLRLILAPRPRHDGVDGPPADAVLELLCNRPLPSGEGLSRETAFATEHGGADLCRFVSRLCVG